MKQLVIFPLIGVCTCFMIIAVGLELGVRFIVDDGMQFDLEMWKYARDVKMVVGDPLIAHRHGPNRNAQLMGVAVRTNSRGLRDREFDFERTPGTRRVLMLGDSLTEGWGVPYEDTFSKRIERMYAERGSKAEVINTGVGNYNTIQEVAYFLAEGYRYHSDIVVLNFFINDAEPLPLTHPPSFLMRHCYACIWITGRIDSLLRQISSRKDWSDYYLGLYGDGSAPGWLDAKAAIKRLADYCKEHDIRLLVANLPELHDVRNYRFGRVTELLRATAAENGVEFVDLLPYLQDQESTKLWVTAPDPHPNAFANQFLAAGLFDALQKLD
jgi:lysophospholipase L1-like esterase